MKITYIVPHFPPHIGGGEQLYHDVCVGLVQRGNQVRVLTSNSGGVTGKRSFDGLDVYYFNWKLVFGHPIVNISDIKEHVKWCDIVHTTIYSTAIKSIKTAERENKPCVTTVHEVMGKKWSWFVKSPLKSAAFSFYERMILKKADNVHVVSESTGRDYLKSGRYRGRVFRIYNFLDLPDDSEIKEQSISFSKLFELGEEEKGILYFGRPAPNKGIYVLLDAIRLLKEELKGSSIFFCMILAPNPAGDRERVSRIIEESGLGDHVRIRNSLGRKELLKVLSEADLCVVPSVTEGFGYAACEACHYNRPIIASDGGSLPEVVSGKCLFFRNRDASDLADKLREYIKNGTSNFEEIPMKVFDRDRIIDEYLDMYKVMLSEKGAR